MNTNLENTTDQTDTIGSSNAAHPAETNCRRNSAKDAKMLATKVKEPTAASSKSDAILRLLRRKKGASIVEMQEATGWQVHSVRGFLSGHVKKKLGLSLASEPGNEGVRRYRVETTGKAG